MTTTHTGTWTGPDGVVHIRAWGTGLTLCGTSVGLHTDTRPRTGCDGCVTASIAAYAQKHVCGPGCRG